MMSLEAALAANTAAVLELTKLLATMTPATPAVETPVETPVEKPKAEKPKAEKPKAEKPKADEAKAEAPVVEYAAVAKAIKDLVAAGKRPAAVAILGELGVASGKELKPAQYADALAKLTGALAS